MPPDRAEELAISAIGWLAQGDGLLDAFLTSSGMDAGALRAALSGAHGPDPMVLAAVLDFVLSQDRWVIAFCTEQGLRHEDIWAARQSLPGGADPHWT